MVNKVPTISPVRHNTPKQPIPGINNSNITQKTAVVGRGGTPFYDISDKEAMKNFINQNHELIKAQSQDFENTKQAALNKADPDVEFNVANFTGKPPQPQRPPTLDEIREKIRLEGGFNPDKKNISNTPDWMDEEAIDLIKILNISHLPIDAQRHIVNSNRKSTKEGNSSVISNINTGDPNAPIDPPIISAKQMRAKIEKEIAEKQDIVKEKPSTAPRFTVKTITANDEDFTPLNFTSGYVFYDFDSAFIRKFNISDILPLHKAKEDGDLRAFIASVGATIKGCDILDLSMGDLRYILYWHQFYSFLKNPLIVRWKSKYGNSNTYNIKERDLKYVTPKMTKEEYKEKWYPLGLTIPTVRDYLFANSEDLTEDEIYLFQKAQWFRNIGDPSSFQAKLDSMSHFCGKNLDALSSIEEFSTLCQHGISEQIDVVDAKFNVQEYLKLLNNQLQILYQEKSGVSEDDFIEIENINEQIVNINEEIASIEQKLERKEEVLPDVETKPVIIEMLDFFPGL